MFRPRANRGLALAVVDDVACQIVAQSLARPSAPALKDEALCLTYSQLVSSASALAGALRPLGATPGDRAVLLLPNSAEFPVSALGCLLAGVAFVPMSPDDPPARLQRLVSNCEPKVVIADERTYHLAGDVAPGVRVARFADLVEASPPLSPGHADPQSDAYLIYTSGTSGEPKGVRISRRAFATAVTTSAAAMGLGCGTRSLCVSPFYFDGSYGTLFTTLVRGGSVIIPARDKLLFLSHFFSVAVEEAATHVGVTPSYLRLLLSSPRCSKLARAPLQSFGLGGEECLAKDVEQIWALRPGARVFNRYGPTETAVQVTTYEVTAKDVEAGKVPIGSPHPGTCFYLLGEDGGLVGTPGETGELWVTGPQLMTGYWKDPELTAQVLRRDVVPGELAYKSGDLAWRDGQGLYFYYGRSDDVLKRAGVRISLLEIENALQRFAPACRRAACVAYKAGTEGTIVAFIEGGEPDAVALYERAATVLPRAMLPDKIVPVPTLPTNPSGKLDRRRLLKMAQGHPGRARPQT